MGEAAAFLAIGFGPRGRYDAHMVEARSTPEEFEQARQRELARLNLRISSIKGQTCHTPEDLEGGVQPEREYSIATTPRKMAPQVYPQARGIRGERNARSDGDSYPARARDQRHRRLRSLRPAQSRLDQGGARAERLLNNAASVGDSTSGMIARTMYRQEPSIPR